MSTTRAQPLALAVGGGSRVRYARWVGGFDPELSDAGCVVVRTVLELKMMAAEILDATREHLVVCLTARMGEDEPALSPLAVRDIMGAGIPIYFIGSAKLIRRLMGLLPKGLDVYGGAARVWRPGVSTESDPVDHPLICDRTREYKDDLLEELAREFRFSAKRIDLTLEQRTVIAERRFVGVQQRNSYLEGELRAMRRRYEELVLGGQPSGTPSSSQATITGGRGPDQDATGEAKPGESRVQITQAAPYDLEGELHRLICNEWVEAVVPSERAVYPLGQYVLAPKFMKGIARRSVDIPLDQIMWTCAMLTCGVARRLRGLNPHPLPMNSGGAQLVRGDGAKGWRCSLKRNTYGGPCIHYWVLPDGTIEFAAVGNHDGLGRL